MSEAQVQSFVVKFVVVCVKLFLLLVVLAFLYMGYVYIFGGAGVGPDWILKGYTNKHYRQAEKLGKAGKYEEAIQEFELAISEESDNEGMVTDCRYNIASCYERIAADLEPLTYAETPEAYEAYQKQSAAYEGALEQYNILLEQNRNNREAMQRRNLLLLKRG